MNKPLYYLSYSALVILSVVVISLEVKYLGMTTSAMPLLISALFCTIVSSLIIYQLFKNDFDTDNLYKMVASSILFNFLIFFATLSFFHRKYASNNCNLASYEVVQYQKRFGTTIGIQDKEKIKPNQWLITVRKNNKDYTFVLNHDISSEFVTNTVEFEFCKGVFDIEYLNH